MQTIPVFSKEIFTSKLKVNFAVALPFYIISEILLIIVAKPNIAELILMILLFPI